MPREDYASQWRPGVEFIPLPYAPAPHPLPRKTANP